jgi:ubiquinol-cytochrome c reductase cytochrome b subunit
MFGSFLILFLLPFTDLSRIRGCQFRPAMKIAFWFFVINFFILMWIGSQHPTEPYVTIGQIATCFYFFWFILFVPAISFIENTLMDIATETETSY